VRKSQFSRTLLYFRTAELAEAQACLESCTRIIEVRMEVTSEPGPKRRKRRSKLEPAPHAERPNGAEILNEVES
jgi:hypothetical protein